MSLPTEVVQYIAEKSSTNGAGGRPHLLQTVDNPTNTVLDICELVWLKNKPIGRIAKKFNVKYHSIYRLLQDLEPHREAMIEYMTQSPRRKKFWIRHTFTSDYETVQNYLTRAKEDELKAFARFMLLAEKAWRALGYKDPANWTKSEVLAYLATLKEGSQSGAFDGIRAIAPQFRDKLNKNYIITTRFRLKLKRRKRNIFGAELIMMREALKAKGMHYELMVMELHITVAFREGAKDNKSGITGIKFSDFKKAFSLVDDYEAKGKTGYEMTWRNCPVDLFFADLPKRLRAYWVKRGKPTDEKLLADGYKELLRIYHRIRATVVAYWQGKVEPDVLKEFADLKPHDADKIHCNLCWEAGIPLEVVAGQDLGKGEGLGLVGRGWKSVDIIKKHYLSLTQRSDRYQQMLSKVREYSKQFNGEKAGQ